MSSFLRHPERSSEKEGGCEGKSRQIAWYLDIQHFSRTIIQRGLKRGHHYYYPRHLGSVLEV